MTQPTPKQPSDSPEPPQPANDDSLRLKLDEALEFLTILKPNRDWCLTSIAPYAPAVERSTRAVRFKPEDSAKAAEWAEGQASAQRNLYHLPANFSDDWRGGNPPDLGDITGSEYLWVDIDPRPDEDVIVAQERILRALTQERPHDVPEPTAVISSGNGMQAFWHLTVTIDPDALAAKNRWLACRLGGDEKTFNPNRLMRVPGTINYPSKTKVSRGRTRQMAHTIFLNGDRVYQPSLFPDMSSPQTKSEAIRTSEHLNRLSNVDLDELPISTTLRAMILHGTDPIDPNRFGSRSEAQFYVSKELATAGISDDVHYSILLDSDFGISAHPLDQAKPEAYVMRQIRRAKEAIGEPALAEMNEKHAVISSVGGKCVVARWVPSAVDPKRKIMQLQSVRDFIASYENKMVGDPKNPKSLGRWWFGHPQRRQYENLIFRPGGDEEINGSLNLWRGFAVKPLPGNWQLLRSHVVDVLADGNLEHAQYILNWTAWMFQNPGRPAEVALVLKGGRGAGKGRFGSVLKRILGHHALQVSSSKQVAGNFNAHLRDTVFLFSDESYFPGAKADEGTLKRLLTEDTLFIEGKGKDAEEYPNCLHVMMASNEEWVVPAGMDERRFAVFQVSDAKKQNAEYFAALEAEVASGGAEAFLFDMLNLDLAGWHPRQVPQTDALAEQKLLSLSPEDEWYLQLLQEGKLPGSSAHAPGIAPSRDLFDAARLRVPKLKDASDTCLGRALTKNGVVTKHLGDQRARKFPSLQEAKRAFEKRLGAHIEWERPDQDDWEPSLPR